jgi:predicted lipid-binding transport protein (Tim44 family)
MRRSRQVAAIAFAALIGFAPGLALARAGDGTSMGSRGIYTYTAPPGTGTAPFAAPIQRSLTPQSSPSYAQPGMAAPRYGSGYGYGSHGSPFMSGLLGGFIGAGIGGLLLGHGLFGGISGFGGFIGFLFQIFLLFVLGRWLFRTFFGTTAVAGGYGGGRMGMGAPRAGPVPVTAIPAGRAIQIGPADYQSFEQLLKAVQAAWSAHDLQTLRAIATPEMVSYFAEQLGEQTSRGVRNLVTDVRLEHGDLAEAWAEDGREYATVAMRFSMTDVTRDEAGHVVDGSLAERITATEVWTFLRAPGGRWVLSAIQQAR